MNTARKQARDVATAGYVVGSYEWHERAEAADAASDVWESLFREVLDRLDEFQDGHPCCDADNDGLVTRAKEALG